MVLRLNEAGEVPYQEKNPFRRYSACVLMEAVGSGVAAADKVCGDDSGACAIPAEGSQY